MDNLTEFGVIEMHNFVATGQMAIRLDVCAGSINIVAEDRTTIVVDVKPSDPAHQDDQQLLARTTVELIGSSVMVRTAKSWRRLTRSSAGSIVVNIRVPVGTDVLGHIYAGGLITTGQLGECVVTCGLGDVAVQDAERVKLRTGVGDLTLGQCRADADLKSSTGQILVDRIVGNAHIKNSTGRTRINTLESQAIVKSSTGDIEIGRALSSIFARTSTGKLAVGEVVSGTVDARSSVGEIVIGVRAGTAAWLDVVSRHGVVHSSLTSGEPVTPAQSTVVIKAATVGSPITIHRSVGDVVGSIPME